MNIVGVDPGKHGAVALINDGRIVRVTPFTGELDKCREEVFKYENLEPVYFIEKVTASPHMGVVSAFTFGRWAEAVESAAYFTGCTVHIIRPVVWQNAIGVSAAGDKRVLYEHAKKLFPTEYEKKMFNQSSCDAVLIAYYGWRCVNALNTGGK